MADVPGWKSLAAGFALIGLLPQAPAHALRLTATVVLAGVEGRIDHLAADVDGRRLFVAALGNDTIEVVDLASLRVTRSIRGVDEPQGLAYVADARQLVVANGGTGATQFLETGGYDVRQTVRLSGDADNVRYDSDAKRVYVGYGTGALAVLGLDGKRLGDIPVGGHPESFQLETSGHRIFVNVPSASKIAVIDRSTSAVVATWPVTTARANYPMALDEAHHRLFVGCRSPAAMLVYDTTSGRLVTSVSIVGDTDDLFYDPTKQRIYVAGGDGAITVIAQQDADHYQVADKVPTAAGARTALFVPAMRRLFLAVPHRGAQPAEVRVYTVD
jgi:YVTN family beta-propeller protein